MQFFFRLSLLLTFSIVYIFPKTLAQNWNQDLNLLQVQSIKNPKQLFIFKKKVGSSFPNNSFIEIKAYKGNRQIVACLKSTPQNWNWLDAWAIYDPSLKYHPSILNWSVKTGNEYKISLSIDPKLLPNELETNLTQLGFTFYPNHKWSSQKLIILTIKGETDLQLLAQQDWIINISPVLEDEPLNKDAEGITGAKLVQTPIALGGAGLTGEGVVVGIGDNVMTKHVDIDDRVIEEFNPSIGSHHAIHVATTVGGAGIKDQQYQGFAPEVDLISQFFSGVIAYGPGLFEDFNMSLTNNSYGANLGDCEYAGLYDEVSAYIDEMAINYPKLLNIFAAGNDGANTCPPYPPGFGTTAGGYQPSKNNLVVANIGKGVNAYHISSSKGPVKDGRIKPEITAIGRTVMSGFKDDNYGSSSGTSMACPNVTGSAALLTQKYKQMFADDLPDNGLIKILLMNGARDVYNFGPDFKYGFGLMDVNQSVHMLQNNQFFIDSIGMGTTQTKSIVIPTNVRRAKIMIYWNDPAASPSVDPTASTLVNDLDFSVMTPSSSTLLPWILDPNNPDNLATTGLDSINNVEQISIENPTPGNYQLNIHGSNVESGLQKYYIAWDFEMDSLSLLSPIGGEQFKNNDSILVFFKNPSTTSTFSCQFSSDNGATWSSISTSISNIDREVKVKFPAGLNSTQCKVRIIENSTGESVASAPFAVSSRISVSIDSLDKQCPGSVAIIWTSHPTAEAYAIFRNIDGKMTAIDTVDATTFNYTISGLPTDTKQWVAVAPIWNGQTLIRAVAKSRIPKDGSCIGSDLPDNDLALVEILNPKNGRILTSSALGNEEYVQVKVQNRSKNPLFNVRLGFVLDDAPEVAQNYLLFFPAGSDTILTISVAALDLSAVGSHQLTVYNRTSSSTEIRSNDTVRLDFEQIDNPELIFDSGYVENFENFPILSYQKNHLGIPGATQWDFEKTAGMGRMKTFVSTENNINGNRSASLDLNYNCGSLPDSVSTNALLLTLNFNAIDISAQEMRADFLYRFSGRPKFLDENSVYLRGSDTSDWIKVLTLDTTAAGTIKYSGGLSINDVLTSNGQAFSTSLQFKIQQKDTSLICGYDYGNGLTIDSFRVYSISNDVSLEGIASPSSHACTYSSAETLQVWVRNNVYYELNNIPVSFKLNDGSIISDTIPSIPAKTSILYTFTNTLDLSTKQIYKINAWTAYTDDDYPQNDSILNFKIYHSPSHNEYPYLATFEENDGGFQVEDSSSFVWGTPDQGNIMTAANGKKSWSGSNIKSDTSLAVSYLYSPCFDLTGLSEPYLSFSLSGNFPFEDSTAPATYAFVEYTTDGTTWQKLGTHSSGHNWYNHATDCWALQYFPWMGVTHPLPEGLDNIKLRWAFVSFPGSLTSNFAIDDIHIYSRGKNVMNDRGTALQTQNISANTETFFNNDGNTRIASIYSTENLNNTKVSIYNHEEPLINRSNEAILPTNFVLAIQNSKPYQCNLYVPHSSVNLLQNTNCEACYMPTSIYELGISNYKTSNLVELNDQLADNQTGAYLFIPKDSIYYKPYMDGYIVQFSAKDQGEFWFNSGGASGNENIGIEEVFLEGKQVNDFMAWLHWQSNIEPWVQHYFLERKKEDGSYEMVYNREKDNLLNGNYTFLDQPIWIDGNATYRLKYQLTDGRLRFTNLVQLKWTKMGTFGIYPNPVLQGDLNFTWSLAQLQKIEYRIVDIAGASVLVYSFEPQTLQGLQQISLQKLGIAHGTYLIEIKCGNEKLIEKFVYLK